MHGSLNVKLVNFDTSLFVLEFYDEKLFSSDITFN
jgi:hypothetical protein